MIRIFNAFIIASGGGARRSSILPVALAARRAGQATFRASVPEGLASFGWGLLYLFSIIIELCATHYVVDEVITACGFV